MDIMMTNNLVIRRTKYEDNHCLYKYLSNPENQKYQMHDAFTLEECQEEFKYLSSQNFSYTIMLAEGRRPIGYLALLKNCCDCYHLAFNMNPDFKEYTNEALSRVLQYAFEELNAHRVVGKAHPKDCFTINEYQKLNMRKEGISIKSVCFRKSELHRCIWWDVVNFAILRNEWRDNILGEDQDASFQ